MVGRGEVGPPSGTTLCRARPAVWRAVAFCNGRFEQRLLSRSQPQFAVDPVLTAAHVIIALQSIVSRNIGSKEEAVVSVTMVHGGEVRAR